MLKNTGFLKSAFPSEDRLCFLFKARQRPFFRRLLGVLWPVEENVCSEVGLCKLFCLKVNERDRQWLRYLGTKFELLGAKEVLGVLMQSALLFCDSQGGACGCRGSSSDCL